MLPEDPNNYDHFVDSLCKPGKDIELSNHQKELLHMILGVAGEVGELVDIIKKYLMYDKPLDFNHVREELGDIEFYLAGVRNYFGFYRDDIIDHNIKKLTKRYPNGYTNEAAQARLDKADEMGTK
jgi:NTP pyrophosphatase (non-canonical NTP hydrolase)